MKRSFSFLVILLIIFRFANGQVKTLQEKLGYSKDAKLLIIHADDLGVSHSENEATINAMEKGSVSSASIMVPTPWFSEIAAYTRSHPKADFGLHLTLTSEWKYYKWGPLADNVPGLNNKEGFLFAEVDSVYKSASIAEVEKELRAQIEKAKQFGVDVTHLDSHMGTLFGNPDYFKLYIRLGREYKVPVLIPKALSASVGSFITDKDIVIEDVKIANPKDFKDGMSKFYTGVLNEIKSGVTELIIHAAFDDKEMQSVTVDHPDYGAPWRQADYNFFTSEACKKILKDQGIQLVTWREIRDKLVR